MTYKIIIPKKTDNRGMEEWLQNKPHTAPFLARHSLQINRKERGITMSIFKGVRNVFVIFLILFASAGMNCSRTSHVAGGDLLKKVARLYGVESFDKIDKIKFTFNVKFSGKAMARSWEWDVSKHGVIMSETGSPPFSYNRDSMTDTASSSKIRKADAAFINDQYWLLFPLHLAWDSFANSIIEENRPLPIGSAAATRITVVYPAKGGYTPGDAFDLFVNNNDTVIQWTYRRGNAAEPTRAARWEDYRRVGPLLLSLSRPGSDSTFHVWFTDVAVQLKGSTVWFF